MTTRKLFCRCKRTAAHVNSLSVLQDAGIYANSSQMGHSACLQLSVALQKDTVIFQTTLSRPQSCLSSFHHHLTSCRLSHPLHVFNCPSAWLLCDSHREDVLPLLLLFPLWLSSMHTVVISFMGQRSVWISVLLAEWASTSGEAKSNDKSIKNSNLKKVSFQWTFSIHQNSLSSSLH